MVERRLQPRPGLPGPDVSLIDRLYAARGAGPEHRDLSLKALLPPSELPNIDTAVERLAAAVRNGEHILIVGDFDADGATSVALAVRVLRAFAVAQVTYLVPNRFDYGYGLSREIVDLAATYNPDLVITVDNGVASVDGVARASQHGIDVIITDHHLPGETLPAAVAVVNPVLDGSRFGSRALAGVGVIYYVLAATRARLQADGWFAARDLPVPNLAEFLDLVAVGTVADVVPLDRNNRILVQQGVARIRAGRACPGVRALIEVAGRSPGQLTATDLGYTVGPRLNAAGRLEDMRIGIRCLLSDSLDEARDFATALDHLNRARRELEQGMVADAELIVAGQLQQGDERVGVCLYDPSWHQGVVGIVAGRLKDRLHRPVIAFADAGMGDEIKGSARSIPGLHIRDLLDDIATSYNGLVPRFGGHAMAAGLTIKRQHLNHFSKIFDRRARQRLPQDALEAICYTDGELGAQEMSLGSVDALDAAGPWGQNFPEPLFQGRFELVSQRVVGGAHLKMSLRGEMPGLVDAIAFRRAPLELREPAQVEIAYRLARNTYGGVHTLQLIVEECRAL